MSLKKTKAWKKLSWYIRSKRDKGICFTCRRKFDPKEMDCGHFIHRNAATFFDENNIHAQCVYCNRFLHGNLGEYALRLEDKIGRKAIEELKKKSRKIKKWSLKELKEIEFNYSMMDE